MLFSHQHPPQTYLLACGLMGGGGRSGRTYKYNGMWRAITNYVMAKLNRWDQKIIPIYL